MSTTFVIDGYNMLHRMLHVQHLSRYRNQDGEFTGGVFGVLNSLCSTFDRFNVRSCIVLWDGGRPIHRTMLLPSYKQDRKTHAENEKYMYSFDQQQGFLDELLPYLGIPSLRIAGFEGDDVFCLVREILDGHITMISEDLDLIQLIDPMTCLWRPALERRRATGKPSHKEYIPLVGYENIEKVTEGLTAKQFIVFKALQGDSDNIPRVTGMRKPIAMATSRQITKDAIIDIVDQVKDYWYANPKMHKFLSYLTELHRNLNLVRLSASVFDTATISAIRMDLINFESTYEPYNERKVLEIIGKMKMRVFVNNYSYWLPYFKRLLPPKVKVM
jgi:5'-3' exonuclease